MKKKSIYNKNWNFYEKEENVQVFDSENRFDQQTEPKIFKIQNNEYNY